MSEKSAKDDEDRPQPAGDGLDSLDLEGQTGLSGSSQSETDASFGSLLRKVAQDDPPPRQLPRRGDIVGEKYRIEERLGRGGMGAVFRATHVISQKPVAIKWMLRSASDEHARRRFVREAHAAGRIDHPNVVDVYDLGQQDDEAYLVMELLRGDSLRGRLAERRLEISEAIDVLLPAMRGVSAVHEAGVIHRDLKPDNIFLCEGPRGAPREAKVLDFGISAMVAREANDATLTQEGAVLGTPAYMSPEQLQNSRDIDARTDVYSFGVILYETLTGVTPFAAESYHSLVLAVVHQEPRNPTALRSDLPSELGRVVLRALAKRREDRYPSVESLITALLPYSSSQASESAQRLPAEEATRHGHLRVWLCAAGGLIAALSVAWWFLDRAAIANEPKAQAAAVRSVQNPRQPAESVMSAPAAVPGAGAGAGAAQVKRDAEPAATPAASSARRPALRVTKSKPRGPPTSPPPRTNRGEDTPKTAPTKARSGSISLDQL